MADRRKGSNEGDKELNPYEIWQEKQAARETAEIAKIERDQKRQKWPFRYLIAFWQWTGIREKKGWDILQLLITASIPLLIFLGTQVFTLQTNNQGILVKYFEGMATLLDDGLLKVEDVSDEKFIIAQAKTVITLQALDPKRQHLVIQFLDASNLNNIVGEDKGLLYEARMSKAKLHQAKFGAAKLIKSDFKGANLSEANLEEANLSNANFEEANLSNTNLSEANLEEANLEEANLSNADLHIANLTRAKLSLVQHNHDFAD